MTEESGIGRSQSQQTEANNNYEDSSDRTRIANSQSAIERNGRYFEEAKKIAILIFNEYLKNDAPY